MALTERDVHYVAELAHLELTPDELQKFLPQLDSILQYMHKLNNLNTSNVDPMAQVTYPAAENPSLRADQVRSAFTQDEALRNAPDHSDGCFKVPRVIERE
jgi:aspartyl-tRNA(Asn)/glutamyl-tRNA(Gln) amidotransferase subunit C